MHGAALVRGDAQEPAALEAVLEGVDQVVYALAAPHPAASAGAAVEQFTAEVPVLLSLLERLGERPSIALTYLSSGGAVYGDAPVQPVPEDTDCHPISPYGVTKHAAERYVLMAAQTKGTHATILRVANAYGALQRPRTGQGIVAALLHAASTDEPVQLFGDGDSVRDYVEVRDVARAVVALSMLERSTKVVNVGTGVGHTLDAVVALAQDVTGRTIRVERHPARVSDVHAVTLEVARLRSLVSWDPMTLEEGVAEAWATWQKWHGEEAGA